jgi:ribosomal protein S18 acetylase RimI-like enzyme
MKKAEEIAANRGCLGIRLDTFSFQAPGFYEKLGYRIFGRLANHPKGHERIYYFKELPDSGRR